MMGENIIITTAAAVTGMNLIRYNNSRERSGRGKERSNSLATGVRGKQ